MENIEIRKISIADLEELRNIGSQTFLQTFSHANTAENMIKYLEESFSTERLTREIEDTDSEIFFATFDDKVIGYLKLNYGEAQTELKDEKAVEIERIYVLEEFHGKKVGQILFEKAVRIARQKDADYLWLGVWEKNSRAMTFYKKNGFTEFNKHIFKLGNDEQTDIMMKLQIGSDL
jgi:diamine N-acetyltransferase